MSQFIHLSFKMNTLRFLKTVSRKLSTMEDRYSQNSRFSEYRVKIDDRTTYPKTFLDGLAVCITINNGVSIMNHGRKNENVTFW